MTTNELPSERRCTRCQEIKPAAAFYTRTRRGRTSLTERCRSCHSAAYYERPVVAPAMGGWRVCRECGKRRHITDFAAHKRYKDGRHYLCKPCHSRREAERRRANPDHFRELKRTLGKDYELRKHYGITRDDYLARLESQGGGCAICGKTPEEEGRYLAVDHDWSCCSHKKRTCGKCVRGILCCNCNRALGYFKDNPDLLRRAVEYLSVERS